MQIEMALYPSAQMDLIYYDIYPNKALEEYLAEYSALQQSFGEPAITVTRADSVEQVLRDSDVRHPRSPAAHPHIHIGAPQVRL